jgi:hypothetical protein
MLSVVMLNVVTPKVWPKHRDKYTICISVAVAVAYVFAANVAYVNTA